jgi:hypothetical protein
MESQAKNEENTITIEQPPRKRKVYCCIDLELGTNEMVTGIGMFAADSDMNTLVKKRWWLEIPKGEKIDDRTMREFWEKNKPVYREMIKEGKPEDVQIKDFVSEFDGLAKKYGIEERDIELFGDNPEVDFGRLTEYIKRQCGPQRGPIRFTTTGQYRSITDYGDAMWYMGVHKEIEELVNSVQKHDHFPDNDAHHNFLSHMIEMKFMDMIKEKIGEEKLKKMATKASRSIVLPLLVKKCEEAEKKLESYMRSLK